jgi:hypothetical protein
MPKMAADPRPTVSRRSHGRLWNTTALTSSPHIRTLERSEYKRKMKTQVKIQLSQATDADANAGDSSWSCFLCAKNSKEDMSRRLQCRSWVLSPCAKVNQSMKKFYCSTCTAR